jgi:hypothetical protein
MLKALLFAHLKFFFAFRGQMSPMGEKVSPKPTKDCKPKTRYKNKNEDPLWSQNSQKRPQNPALGPYMQKGLSVPPPGAAI